MDENFALIDVCDDRRGEDSNASSKMQDAPGPLLLEDIDALLNGSVEWPASMPSASAPSPTPVSTPSTARSTKKKRVRSAASSSTALQRRKKDEINSLREEVAKLAAYLAQLRVSSEQQRSVQVGTSCNDRDSDWKSEAHQQYRERYQAEKRNKHLKGLLMKQWKLCNNLRRVLYKRNVLSGVEFVRLLESPDTRVAFDRSWTVWTHLEEEVDNVFHNFRHIYRPQEGSLLGSTARTMYSENCKSNTLEFVTVTPLGWPMKAVFNNVWTSLASSSIPSRKPNTLELNMMVTVPGRGSIHHFHKMFFARVFEEKDRIILVWSVLLQSMAKRNIQLRAQAHAVFTQSETNPFNACVLHTNLKLYVTSLTGGQNLTPDDTEDGALFGMGRMMRQFWQNEQNRLLELTTFPGK